MKNSVLLHSGNLLCHLFGKVFALLFKAFAHLVADEFVYLELLANYLCNRLGIVLYKKPAT